MDVHNELGHGFQEAVYGDALMIEFEKRDIPFKREQKSEIEYKGRVLQHKYSCLLYTSPSPRDGLLSRMPSSA